MMKDWKMDYQTADIQVQSIRLRSKISRSMSIPQDIRMVILVRGVRIRM
jgi:hypothetical protein